MLGTLVDASPIFYVISIGPAVIAGIVAFVGARRTNLLQRRAELHEQQQEQQDRYRLLVLQLNKELRNLYIFESVLENALTRVLVAAASNGYEGFKAQAEAVVDRPHIRPSPPFIDMGE